MASISQVHPELQSVKAASVSTLLQALPAISSVKAGKLRFTGVGERDVYNITAPFCLENRVLIAGRVEARHTESSEIMFFSRSASDIWSPVSGAPTFPQLQDPCITFIDGELVLGGVRFPVTLADGSTGWQMEFYRGRNLHNLTRCLVGPAKMKDIRLAQLPDGRIAVFSRPQGLRGGRGQIGFTTVKSLAALTPEIIDAAPLLPGQFQEEEWGGANEIHLLSDGRLGILGHIANFDAQGNRHYFSMAFTLDPACGQAGPLKIIARRSGFPAGIAKRPDLEDVIFSGGLLRHWDGTASLFVGTSDAEAAWMVLADPFC